MRNQLARKMGAEGPAQAGSRTSTLRQRGGGHAKEGGKKKREKKKKRHIASVSSYNGPGNYTEKGIYSHLHRLSLTLNTMYGENLKISESQEFNCI